MTKAEQKAYLAGMKEAREAILAAVRLLYPGPADPPMPQRAAYGDMLSSVDSLIRREQHEIDRGGWGDRPEPAPPSDRSEMLDLLAYHHHPQQCYDCSMDAGMQRASTCPTVALLKRHGK